MIGLYSNDRFGLNKSIYAIDIIPMENQEQLLEELCGMSFSIYRFIAISAIYTQPKSKKCGKFVIFSVYPFGYSGRNIYLCYDFCNILIINGYFRFLRHVCNIRC